VPGIDDEDAIEDLPAAAADPPFHDRVRARRPDRRLDDLDAFAEEHRVEHRRELRVPIADQELELRHTVAEVYDEISCLLGDPVRGGMFGDGEDVYPAGRVLDDREAVQPCEQHGVAMEEVACQNPLCLGTQEFGPGRARASGTWIYPGPFEDCPDCGGADLAAQAVEFSGDAPVSPSGVLLGHAQDQLAGRGLCGWSSWSSTLVSPVSLDEVGVPA
jgi:hypothetical protein